MKFNLYLWSGGIALLPYIMVSYYKYQGTTSYGCVKLNIQMGWFIFALQITTKHDKYL